MTDLLRGKSGRGLDDACSVAGKPHRRPGGVQRRDQDEGRLTMLLGWLAGRDCNGQPASVPVLSGISLTEATTSPKGLAAVDDDVRRVLTELRHQHLDDSTWIVVASPFAPSSELATPRVIPIARLREALDHAGSGRPRVLHISSGRVAMVWLADPSRTDAAAASVARSAESLGIQRILVGTTLTLTWNNPEEDARVPNLILEANPGVTWIAPTSRGSASGMGEDETHVALLVAGAQLDARQDKTPVPTTQLAPLLLRALGLEKFDLEALQKEHTPALPGIF
jgi:arylsulfatase A-like enzyme